MGNVLLRKKLSVRQLMSKNALLNTTSSVRLPTISSALQPTNNSAQQPTKENVHLPTSSLVLRLTRSSVLLHMIRSAPHLMSRNVPRQVMVSRSVVKFPKRIATKFRGRRVPRYLENLVIKYPGRSAMMCLDKAASRFQGSLVD